MIHIMLCRLLKGDKCERKKNCLRFTCKDENPEGRLFWDCGEKKDYQHFMSNEKGVSVVNEN